MLVDFGEAALWAALLIGLVQGLAPFWLRKIPALIPYRLVQFCSLSCWCLITIAFATLIYAFATTDLSVATVAYHSQGEEPLLYRICAAWGNHEGSMLLWVWILSGYQAVVALSHPKMPMEYKTLLLQVFSVVMLAFLLFVLLTSNPFERFVIPAKRGIGLNPILQDPAMGFHPPILYLGYIGFVMPFLFAWVALLTQKCDAEWVNWVQPWVLFSWSFLTLGITLGSWWAYYELGWGGWWFWDPVENVSLLPWFLGTALLHSLRVIQMQESVKVWTILLCILTFALCLLGTLIVRSGLLTSVHSFAYDPKRGLFLAILIVVLIVPSLLVFGIRSRGLRTFHRIPLIGKPGAITLQNYAMVLMTVTLLVGTLYPLLRQVLSLPSVVVSATYFNNTLIPLSLPFLFLMGFIPVLKWKESLIGNVLRKLHWQLTVTALIFVLLLYFMSHLNLLAVLTLIAAIWLLLTSVQKFQQTKEHGMSWAHLGFGLALLGMSVDVLFEREQITALKVGEQTTLGDYQFQLAEIERHKTDTYMAEKGVIKILKNNQVQSMGYPEKRFYISQEMLTTEVALFHHGLSQYYIVLGGLQQDDRRIVKLYYHPLVSLIWLGGFLMFCGGMVSLGQVLRRSLLKSNNC